MKQTLEATIAKTILNSYGGDACPCCGYGAWWGTLRKDEEGKYVRSEQDIEASAKLAKRIVKALQKNGRSK